MWALQWILVMKVLFFIITRNQVFGSRKDWGCLTLPLVQSLGTKAPLRRTYMGNSTKQNTKWKEVFVRTIKINAPPPQESTRKRAVKTSSYQAWFFSFLSSFVAHVARVFALLVFDLRPSVNSSWIIGLASTNFRTSFPNAVHKSLCKINTPENELLAWCIELSNYVLSLWNQW